MADDVKIRMGKENDVESLVSFNIEMALETEDKGLPSDVVFAGVKHVFRNPRCGFYVVAEKRGRIAGSLMVTTEWSDWRNGEFWWIQSVYVRPEFRRQGVYRQLYDFVRTRAAEKESVRGFRLYVDRDNIIAQNTYRKMGMEETPYKLLEESI